MSAKHSPAKDAGSVDEDKVRERAYHLWEKAGRPEGNHDHHWDEAHRQVAAEKSGKVPEAKAEPKADAAAVKPAAKTTPKTVPAKTEASKADAAKKKATKSV